MKKVLIITYYWPPSAKASLYWPFDMVKYLPDYNWHPAVLTAVEDSFSFKDENLLKDINPNVVVLRTRSPEPFKFYKKFIGKKKDDILIPSETISASESEFRKKIAIWIRMNLFVPDSRVGWYFESVMRGRNFLLGNYFDAMISVGPPHTAHLIGKRLSQMYSIPHIPVFIDPWTDIVYYKNFKRNKAAVKLDNYLENGVLRNAKQVVFVTETMKTDYEKKYDWLEEKSHLLYWGYNEEYFTSLSTFTKKEETGRSDEEVLLHAGNIFDYQNPKLFWKYLKNLVVKGRKIKIKFIGTVSPKIKESLSEAGLNEIIDYTGFLSYNEMLIELTKASYLLVCASEPRHVPGKLFEYLRTGKPIIAFGDGNDEVREILNQSNAGMLFSYSQDGHEFFDNLINFNTSLDAVKKYDRRKIAESLSHILGSLSLPNSPP